MDIFQYFQDFFINKNYRFLLRILTIAWMLIIMFIYIVMFFNFERWFGISWFATIRSFLLSLFTAPNVF